MIRAVRVGDMLSAHTVSGGINGCALLEEMHGNSSQMFNHVCYLSLDISNYSQYLLNFKMNIPFAPEILLP